LTFSRSTSRLALTTTPADLRPLVEKHKQYRDLYEIYVDCAAKTTEDRLPKSHALVILEKMISIISRDTPEWERKIRMDYHVSFIVSDQICTLDIGDASVDPLRRAMRRE
jgi:hypothetical protein